MLHENTIIYWLFCAYKTKIIHNMQEINGRESSYEKLQRFHTVHFLTYMLKNCNILFYHQVMYL